MRGYVVEEKLIIKTEEIMKIYGEGDALVKALDGVDMQIRRLC